MNHYDYEPGKRHWPKRGEQPDSDQPIQLSLFDIQQPAEVELPFGGLDHNGELSGVTDADIEALKPLIYVYKNDNGTLIKVSEGFTRKMDAEAERVRLLGGWGMTMTEINAMYFQEDLDRRNGVQR
jgi:hypothetical protein